MTVTFNTNLSALTSQRYLGIAADKAGASLSKLSSGSRVPSAKDDAAALAVGSKLKAEVVALAQASNNASQASSLLQIADGALSTVGDILQRMKALATQSSSGQLGNAERSLLNQEFTNLRTEVDRIANVTNFNGTTLLSGSSSSASSNINNLSSTGGATEAKNLVSEGVKSIDFSTSFSGSAVKLSFDATNNYLTLTNLTTNQSQSVDIGGTAIAAGATQSVNFSSLGATVTLDSNFNKSISSTVTNGYRSISYAVTGAQAAKITASTASISEFRLKEADGLNTANLSGVSILITGAASGGTAGAGSTVAATVTADDGSTRSFSVKTSAGATGGTVDLSGTGARNITLIDSAGNEFDVAFTQVTALANTDSITITPTVVGVNTSALDINADDFAVAAVVTAGNGTTPTATSASISSIAFDGTGGLKASDLNGVVVTVTSTTVAAATATATVGGVAFAIKDGGSINLSTNGAESFIMADGNGNEFTVAFTSGGTYGTTTSVALTATADHIPAIQNSSIKLEGVSKGSASTFDFGTVDDATVTFTTTSASAATASLTLNGTTFTSSAVNLTTTGTKTVTLTNGSGTSATSLTFSFNLRTALDNADSFSLELGELGQLVGATTSSGATTSFSFKVGTGVTTNDSIVVSLNSATTSTLAIDGATVDTATNADTAIGLLNTAITTISSNRASVGAAQSRLDFAAAGIGVAIENFTAATSALLDVDVSAEITEFTSQNVLLQAGISLLAQANQQPSLLLRLLQ